jgi:hypothetical protein
MGFGALGDIVLGTFKGVGSGFKAGGSGVANIVKSGSNWDIFGLGR